MVPCSLLDIFPVVLACAFSSSPFVEAEHFVLCCHGLDEMLFLLCGWMLASG